MKEEIKIVVSGKVLDYFEDSNIKLQRITDSLTDPTQKQFESSFQFDLPRTSNNNEAFGFADADRRIGRFVYRYECQIEISSLVVFKGFIELQSLTEDKYIAIVYNDVINFSDEIKNKKLADIRSFGVIPFSYEQTQITWTNQNYDVDDIDYLTGSTSGIPVTHQYPFVIYDRVLVSKWVMDGLIANGTILGGEALATNRAPYWIVNEIKNGSNIRSNYFEYFNFPPALYVCKTLQFICEEAGWSLDGSLIHDPNFRRLITLYTGDSGIWDIGNGLLNGLVVEDVDFDLFSAHNSVVRSRTSNAPAPNMSWATVRFDTEDFDPNDNYNSLTGVYTSPALYRTKFYFDGDIAYGSAFSNFKGYLRFMSSLKGELYNTLLPTGWNNSGVHTHHYETQPIDCVAGEQIYIQIGCTDAGYPGQTGFGAVNIQIGSTFYQEILGATGESAELNLVAFLPDMSQSDFLKEIIKLYNGYLVADPFTKTIYLEPYEKYFLPSQYAIDISNKLIQDDFTIDSLDEETRKINLVFDNNTDDNMSFIPNNLQYPRDYTALVRDYRRKQIKYNGVVYKYNEIFNQNNPNAATVESKIAPVNYRQMWLSNQYKFDGSAYGLASTSGTSYIPIHVPMVSSVDSMYQQLYDPEDIDDLRANGVENASYGSGFRVVKYDGIGAYYSNTDSGSVEHDVYWVYNGITPAPNVNNTNSDLYEAYKMKIGLTSQLDTLSQFTDDDYNTYFYTYSTNQKVSPLNLKFNHNRLRQTDGTFIGWNKLPSGVITADDSIYSNHFSVRYDLLERAEIVNGSFNITAKDWIDIQPNVPINFRNETYDVLQFLWEPDNGVAKLKILKRTN